MAADGVVAVQPAERASHASRSPSKGRRPWSTSRLQAALNDPASALSAELPIALMLWITPAERQASAKARCSPPSQNSAVILGTP